MTSNVYAALLETLLSPAQKQAVGLFGTLTAISPLTVRVRGTEISNGLFCPRGMSFYEEQIGSELALIPCEEGFLILFEAEGRTT